MIWYVDPLLSPWPGETALYRAGMELADPLHGLQSEWLQEWCLGRGGETWRYEIEGLWSRLSSISNVDSKVGYQCGELWEEVKDGRR